MPNKFDQRKLVDHLIQDKDAELMPYELNDILEKELSKPAEEIDMQLIDDLLASMEVEDPSAAVQKACWQSIQRRRRKAKRSNWQYVMRRSAAAVAILLVMFIVSFESAKAFRWTFLLKLLAPVAETFGIYSTSTFDSDDPVIDNTELLNEDTEYEQVAYLSIEEMPSEISGYKTVPAWVPERFSFVQGTTYEDPDMAYCALAYKHEDQFLCADTYVYYNDAAVFSYEFERTLPEPQHEEINGLSVSYYSNKENGELISASWIDGAAHYHVEGKITKEELKQIVRSYME